MLDKFLVYLRANPMALSISSSSFSAAEITALMRVGFLTSSVQGLNSVNVFAGPKSGSSGTLTSISSISKAASGSLAAVGGEGAIYDAGGRGGIRRSSSQLENSSDQKLSEKFSEGVELRLSLPGTGAYLKVRLLYVIISWSECASLVAILVPGKLIFFCVRYSSKICHLLRALFEWKCADFGLCDSS